MKKNSKKTTIIHVLRVLYNYTSQDFPATQTAIAEYLSEIDVHCTRKTVGRNLKYLIDMGAPIKRKRIKGGGYYYEHENDTFLKIKE